MNLYSYIEEKFNSGVYLGKSKKYIFSDLGAVDKKEKKSVENILSEIEKTGKIIFTDGKYYSKEQLGLKEGVLKGNEKGYAFLISQDENAGDIFIPNRKLFGAEHKDRVLVKISDFSHGNSDEGEVVKILSRGITNLCGTYYTEKRFGFVRPDDKNYFDDIFVSFKNSFGAKNGDKVQVKIIDFPVDNNPEGVIEQIIGKKGDLIAEENSIILGFGYKDNFPTAVLKETDSFMGEVDKAQLVGREDLTSENIITIDGDDSRDFDDAVCVKKTDKGTYILGVHIADVSEYVKTGSAIDKEAYDRGTSVYFPDRVIPMLPEKLSNGLCSLSEGDIRLTLSCEMETNSDGEIIDKRIFKSFIKSKHRMTYKKVQAILDGDKQLIDLYADVYDMLKDMETLKDILYKKRATRGNIDLDVKEAYITFDGKDIEVSKRGYEGAYRIIEEFMISANETVAEYAYYMDVPLVYRVHGKPNAEKIKTLKEFLFGLGVSEKINLKECYPSQFQAVLKKTENSVLFPIINRIMLRCMQKAKYSPENIGHFGLASKCYCHFTSPIRRYPDLVVHRIIKSVLDGEIGELIDLYKDFCGSASENSSEKERTADEAEREVDELYKTKYMETHIGEEYDAVISGVIEQGVFSELDNTVEGFTSVKDLPRGQYRYDEKAYCLYSGKHRYKLGDKVRVGVMGADISRKRVDFIILKKYED